MHTSMAATERHFRVAEIAEMWAMSKEKVRQLFRDEPGVIMLGGPTRLVGRKYRRRYFILRVPESVLIRVHERLRRKSA